MWIPSDRSSRPAAQRCAEEQELRLFRQALAEPLRPLRAPGEERQRIEDELSQMLRDEAEAAGIDCSDETAVAAWVATQADRLAEVLRELHNEVPPPDPAPRGLAVPAQESSPDHQNPRGRKEHRMNTFLQSIFADAVVATRSLRKRPGLTSVILITLILSIGLNSAVFSVLNSVFLKPAAVANSQSLVKLFTTVPNGFLPEEPMALPDLFDLRESPAVEDLAAQAMTFCALNLGDEPAEIVLAEMASDNTFDVLGVKPRLGRLFHSPGGASARSAMLGNEADVAIISSSSWRRRFDGDPGVLGKVIRLNGHPLEIIGVMPPGYRGLARGLEPEFWVPLETSLRVGLSPSTNSGNTMSDSLVDDRGRRSLWAVARLAPGFDEATASAELTAVAMRLEQQYPKTNEDRSVRVIAYDKVKVMPALDASINTASGVLLGVVFLVLLIACTNLANLLLARAMARRGEMATRLSLGASRLVIVRQLLVESLLLGAMGAVGGLGLAFLASRLVNQARLMLMVPIQVDVVLDGRVVLFTIALALATVVIFGLAPAFEASRTSLLETMKESSNRGGKKLRLQSALVAVQVAFSVVLLIFAGLALRSIRNAAEIDLGFEPEGVAGLIVAPSSQGYEEEQAANFYRQLEEDLRALPAVREVSLASHVPLNLAINTTDAVPMHRVGDDPDTWPEVDVASVDETYFDVLQIPMLRGRTFRTVEREQRERVVVVNRTLAEQFWPGLDPVGQELATDPGGDPYRVVGMVGDGKYRTVGESPRPFLYFALGESPSMVAVLARFERPEEAGHEPLQRVVRKLDPHLAVTGQGTLSEMTSISLLLPKAAVAVFGALGLIGLLLSAIGLFGVLAYSVSQRTHEIGLRVAIGASRADVLALVARRGLALAAIGIASGSVIAFAVTRFLRAILYGISPTDAPSFLGGAGVLLVVALVASVAPARSALRVDPTQALRCE